MNQNEINKTIEKHEEWLDTRYTDNVRGERADFRGANLEGMDFKDTDLRSVNFRDANLQDADLQDADLRGADLQGANCEGANFQDADLRYADLEGANFQGADLDFSCLPLWCGSLGAHFDDKQLRQIAYHLVRAGLNSKNASTEAKKELAKLVDFANEFHRAGECGKIEIERGGDK